MINIQEIIPFMKKGWVAMDKNGRWWWFKRKPTKEPIYEEIWEDNKGSDLASIGSLEAFDIAPADDWTKSLIKVGGK